MSTKRERELVQRLSDEWDKFIGVEGTNGVWHDGSDDLMGLVEVIVELRDLFGVTRLRDRVGRLND